MDVLCRITHIDIDAYVAPFPAGDKQTHLSGYGCHIYSPLIHLNPSLSIRVSLSVLCVLIECKIWFNVTSSGVLQRRVNSVFIRVISFYGHTF